ncbi:GNAT family N-acetyltransferase [Nocardioides exalbidus]|uniref:GNAT family N-acetyltransferase n=1 Tax=Nocardioides exalbidus TaxID=402596 RepID=UPI001FE18BD0|nr:GNAT family N-acetyltransferase [Nocardioides exalbidus]
MPDPDTTVDEGPVFTTSETAVTATVAGRTIGAATWTPDEEGAWLLELEVDPAWRRRSIGSKLLLEATRAARTSNVSEVVVRTAADNSAVLPLVLGSGLRGRIRMGTDDLTVRIPITPLVRSAY